MSQTTSETIGTLRGLYFYNDWARDHIMERAVALTDEQLDQPFEMGPGSLRKTLWHMWDCERGWLSFWREGADSSGAKDEGMSMQDLWTSWRQTATERDEFLDGVGEAGHARQITFVANDGEWTFPLGDMMLHVCNHGTHHRAQVLNMMRHVGVEEPPGVDYLFMKLEDSPQPAVAFDRDTVAEYFAYNDWGWRTIYGLVSELDDEALDRLLEMGVGSLRKTLTHGFDAEHWWLRNWAGEPAATFEELPADVSMTRLTQMFDETTAHRNAFIAGCTNEDLQREIVASPTPDREYRFRLGDTMLQICGHGTHHRAQVINMLRRFGEKTPEMDYLDWYDSVH